VAVSPDGRTAYVTGSIDLSYTTIAYDVSTRLWRWVKHSDDGRAQALAVSPDGSTVFVTGTSYARQGGSAEQYRTVAYDAQTGGQLWAASYNTGSGGQYDATAVAVSPDGGTVYVTGYCTGGTGTFSPDPTTVAYNATTGAQLWASSYDAPFGRAWALAVSPDGSTLYVTGSTSSGVSTPGSNYATVAYDASTGAQLWKRSYNGPGNRADTARAVAVSPDGSTVYVTGTSAGARSGSDHATIAYNAATGATIWVMRYNGPANGADFANALAIGKNGSVYVTGRSQGATSGYDYATVAYAG
jgi:outer membrane protein assembly factor BamB